MDYNGPARNFGRTITYAALESIFCRLSFAKTSVFGAIGRGAIDPLYMKLRTEPYLQRTPSRSGGRRHRLAGGCAT